MATQQWEKRFEERLANMNPKEWSGYCRLFEFIAKLRTDTIDACIAAVGEDIPLTVVRDPYGNVHNNIDNHPVLKACNKAKQEIRQKLMALKG